MGSQAGRKLSKSSIVVLKAIFELGKVMVDSPPDMEFLRTHRSSGGHWRGYFLKMYGLQRNGYVEVKKTKNNQSFFHLTPKGKLSILKYLHLEKLKIEKWDGHWRIIIFDIPEDRKKWRDNLRNKLKYLGFHPLQESVYITPYPVLGELDKFLEEWNLRKHFRYITVTEIDDEEELKEIFGIK